MNALWTYESQLVFLAVLILTFFFAWKGQRDSNKKKELNITQQGLNRWLIGLSAGSTANSGFVVTGAVGLGYAYGLHWILLPIAWLLGDLVFWKFFAHKITEKAKETSSSTLTDLISSGLNLSKYHPIKIICTLITVLCLGGYCMAQWTAGDKFLSGAFGLEGNMTLIAFTLLITAYTAMGQFRGSVYVDTFQAITRLLGTLIVFGAVCVAAYKNWESFKTIMLAEDSSFLSLMGGSSLITVGGFVLGYAFASLGFGLGQPQVTSRFIASKSPEETQAAKWIYISYVQITWLVMTLFGIVLKGVMPEIQDPEQGLTIFVTSVLPPLLVGFILADIFGAIASTANSILVSMSHSLRDLFSDQWKERIHQSLSIFFLSGLTLLGAIILRGESSVFSIAVASISFMAAGLAPAVAIKTLNWRHTTTSIFLTILIGITSALVWKLTGLSTYINESAIGIVLGLITNSILTRK